VSALFEPGDGVSLKVVRAERVLPDDIYWGIERPGEGFALMAEGRPVPMGAVPEADGQVRIGSFSVAPQRLVLVQNLSRRR
jgi:hypothetical protein